jgi:hypothetical protein
MTIPTKRQAPPVPLDVAERLMDRTGLYSEDGGKLTFWVQITNVRMRWGHVDVLIKPLKGQGSKWIDVERMVL